MSVSDHPRIPVRTAVLDLVAGAAVRPQPGPPGAEELEFLAALRRIVERSPAEELWDKYRGSRSDGRSRIFARFAD
jgi:hypothetical protein